VAKEQILVVEDDRNIRELIEYALKKAGYRILGAGSGEDALKAVRAEPPDLIVLDLMLPGMDGLEFCRRLKDDPKTRAIPVVMLTAKSDETDIVTGLELGADDYITKPFSPRVVVARIRAILRRRGEEDVDESAEIRRGDLVIQPERHAVLAAGAPVELTFTQFRILHLLARRPGRVFTRYQIIDAVRGDDYPVTDRSVDFHIATLRKKLGDHGPSIETVRGVGYRFRE